MCGLISADEARHEHGYQRIIDGVFERDPDGAVLAFADMMRKQIVMPAHLMRDGVHDTTNPGRNLFAVRALPPDPRRSISFPSAAATCWQPATPFD